MRVLDLDMDYFMKCDVSISSDASKERLPEEVYGNAVWPEEEVRNFIENHLGLSKTDKVQGLIVTGHDEALYFGEK